MKMKTELASFCLKSSVLLLLTLSPARGQDGELAAEPQLEAAAEAPQETEAEAPQETEAEAPQEAAAEAPQEAAAEAPQETEAEAPQETEAEASPAAGASEDKQPVKKPEGTPVEEPRSKEAPPAEKPPNEQKQSGPGEPKKEHKVAKKPKSFHADTPLWLKNRLRISTAAAFGVGTGETNDFSSDYLGFSLSGLYALHQISTGALAIRLVSGARYSTHSGVLTDANKEAAVQRFLMLAGSEFRPKKAGYRFGVLLGLGLAKNTTVGFASTNRFKSTYGFAMSIEAHYAYRIYKKIALQTALEAEPLDNGWYGLSVGPTLSF